jgi:uncharacterized protein
MPATRAATGPLSPCISICALGADRLCTGCLRSAQEIARWSSMSPSEQWQLLDTLEQRRKLRSQPVVGSGG